MLKLLRKWLKGNKFSARHLNEVVEVCKTVNPIKGEGAAEVTTGVQGTSINVPITYHPRQNFRAKITAFLGYDYDPSSTELQLGVGIYSARLIKETPAGINVSHTLIQNVPVVGPGEEDPGYEDIIVINEAEVGKLLGGFIPRNEIVIVWPTSKVTDESPVAVSRKVYRTKYWPLQFPATISEVTADPVFNYGWQKKTDTTRPSLGNATGAANFGTKTLRYAVNALEPITHQQPVPIGTVVNMVLTYDTNGVAVYRFWYSDLTVGSFCDATGGTTHGLANKYSDTIGIGAISFEQYDFEQSVSTVRSGNGKRYRVAWGGLTVLYYGAIDGVGHKCHNKMIKFDQGGATGTPGTTVDYSNVDGWTKAPIEWVPSQGSQGNPCDSCDPNDQNYIKVDGFIYIPPGTATIYNQGSSLGTYSILDTGSGIISSLTGATAKLVWTGFLGYNCTDPSIPTGASLTTGGGFTSIQTINGITLADSGGGIARIGLNLLSADSSVTITKTTCGTDLSVGLATFYSDGTIVGSTGVYSKVDTSNNSANRIELLAGSGGSVDRVYIHWMGITASGCSGSVVNSAGLPTADGFSGIVNGPAIDIVDGTGGVMKISWIAPTVNVSVAGGSGSGSFDLSTPCTPVFNLTITPPTATTPTFSIGTVTGLPAGSTPTVDTTGSVPPAYVLNFGIPAGANGTNGIDGTDGTNGTDGSPGLNPTDLPNGSYPLSTGTGGGIITNNGSIDVSGGQITGVNPIQFIA